MLQTGFLVGFPHLSFFFFSCFKNELFYLSLVLLCFNFFFFNHVLLMKSEVFSTYPNLSNLKPAIFITGSFLLLTEIHVSFPRGVGIFGSSPDVLNNTAPWLFSLAFLLLAYKYCYCPQSLCQWLGICQNRILRNHKAEKVLLSHCFSMMEQCCLFNRGNKFRWGADQANLWGRLLSLGSWKKCVRSQINCPAHPNQD